MRRLTAFSFFSLALLSLAPGLPSQRCLAAAPDVVLPVRVFNVSPLSGNELRLAALTTSRLFRNAKVKLVWEFPREPGLSYQPGVLSIEITKGPAPALRPRALGVSEPFLQDGIPIAIFYDRVLSLHPRAGVPLPDMLGLVMAHEIGHVLLQSCEHSRHGIMQTGWSEGFWNLAAEGLISFDPAQRRLLLVSAERFAVLRLQFARAAQPVNQIAAHNQLPEIAPVD